MINSRTRTSKNARHSKYGQGDDPKFMPHGGIPESLDGSFHALFRPKLILTNRARKFPGKFQLHGPFRARRNKYPINIYEVLFANTRKSCFENMFRHYISYSRQVRGGKQVALGANKLQQGGKHESGMEIF